GLASRYWNSDLIDYVIAIYEMGAKHYPNYYDFHLQLYELLLSTDKERAKKHLNRASELLNTVETNYQTKNDIIEEINKEKIKNGWYQGLAKRGGAGPRLDICASFNSRSSIEL